MKRLYYLALILGLNGSNLNAQNLSFEWAKHIGSTEADAATSISIDHLGNVISIGTFKGTVDFDTGIGTSHLTALGDNDIYILKTNSAGELLWVKSMGGTSTDYGLSVTVDGSGNIYSTGYFQNTVDFDPGSGVHNLTSDGGTDIYVQKLSSEGEFIWAKHIGGVSVLDIGYSIKVDDSGNVYTTGSFGNVVDFDPGSGVYSLACQGGYDIFIQKLDSSGDFVWAKRMGETSNYDIGYALNIDNDGNVYTGGIYRNTVDFDPGSGTHTMTSAGGNDIFIQKLSPDGEFQWVKSFGGTAVSDVLYSITIDDENNIYTTGGFGNVVDFDPSTDIYNLTSEGEDDMFVQKLDSDGNFLWATHMGGDLGDIGRSIAVDDIGSVYTTGYFRGNFTVPTLGGMLTLNSEGGDDIFIQKQDASGQVIWIKQMGSLNHDRGLGLDLDNDGFIYTTGYFSDTVDFNPILGGSDLITEGGYDSYVHKLSQCFTSAIDEQVSCDPFIWMDGNIYTESTSQATHIITDGNGCDSIIRLNLTIPEVELTVSINPTTLTSNQNGATYRWFDCDDNYAVISGETNQSYMPPSNGNYAVEVTTLECSDTSACFSFQVIDLEEHALFNNVVIYPNPTSGKVTINLGKLDQIKIKIYDVLGKVVQTPTKISNSTVYLDILGDSGVYLIELLTNNSKRTYRVIKH